MKNSIIVVIFFSFISTLFAKTFPVKISGQDLYSKKTKTLILQRNNKKATVVLFLSTKCPCSRSHFPHFIDLANKFKDFNFVAVHSNEDESLKKLEDYYKEIPQRLFNVYYDYDGKLAEMFGAVKTPHSFIISPKGELLYHGGCSDASNFQKSNKKFLAAALEQINQGKKPEKNYARALGCYIRR